MSLHPVRVPTREELVATYSKPLPKALGTLALLLAALGAVVFVIGLFVDPNRAWAAYHANWLFFTVLSSAGVMLVAVQRITTARWSRPIVRLLEGYVAFLPVAFVLLLISLFIGKGHIFPWTHEAPHSSRRARSSPWA
jgi:Ni/Fe-hydrogenase subunit HybB-like protein